MRKTTVNLSDRSRDHLQQMKPYFGSFRVVVEFAIESLYNGFFSKQLRPPTANLNPPHLTSRDLSLQSSPQTQGEHP